MGVQNLKGRSRSAFVLSAEEIRFDTENNMFFFIFDRVHSTTHASGTSTVYSMGWKVVRKVLITFILPLNHLRMYTL